MTMASVSLLVPTYNRADVIARIWKSWLALRGLTQIVLVDDGSSQDYQPLLQELRAAAYSQNVELVYLKRDAREGSPAAKNEGLAHCTGDYIITTDDDITLAPDMAETLIEAARAKGPNAVIGARVVYRKDGESEEQALARSRQDRSEYFNPKGLTLVPWAEHAELVRTPFVTAVALWPAHLFKAGLRYFTGYGGNGYREETDPQLSAQSQYGATIWYCAPAICYHLPPAQAYGQKSGQRRGGILWYEYWVVRNNVTFLRRHGQWMKTAWGLPPVATFFGLLKERVGLKRWLTLLKKFNTKR